MTLCFLAFSVSTFADAVGNDDGMVFGKIVRLNDSSISIARGCSTTSIKTIPRNKVKFFVFDSDCKPHPLRIPTAGLSFCDVEKTSTFIVYFKGQEKPLYADAVFIGADNLIHISMALKGGQLCGPRQDVDMVINDFVCLDALPVSINYPPNFCFEEPNYAVNFSFGRVFNNQIFTRGFTFYLDVIGHTDSLSALQQQMSSAFGTAILLWTAGLSDYSDSTDTTIRKFIQSITFFSDKHTLLVPPQIVPVDCSCRATFVVKLFLEQDKNFVDSRFVAKAQVEGRTILLNGFDYKYYATIGDKKLRDNGLINLITVFAHEIGHAFGLAHTNTGMSIMNSNKPASAPTEQDVQNLVKILKQRVRGTSPGFFNESQCSGLRVR